MNTTKRLLKSSAARTIFTAVYAVISFFFMPFLVRHLGDRWYGIWILVTSLIANSYLLDVGMTSAVTRFVAKHIAAKNHRATNEVINTCIVIYSVLAAIIVVLTLIVSAFAHHFVNSQADLNIIRATMILIGLQYAAEFPFKAFSGVVSSYIRYDLLVLSRLLNVLLSTGLMVYFVGHGHGILSMAVIVLLTDQLSNFLYFRIAKYLFPDLRLGREYVNKAIVPELFSYSSWSFVIQLANQLRFRTDSLIIGWSISASAVTYYAVGLRLVEYFVDFILKATNMMTPVFTRYFFEKNFDEIRQKYLFLTRLNAALGLFGAGMLVVLGRPFIVRWMGPDFEQSYMVVVILAIAMLTEVIGIYADNILYAISRHKGLAVMNVIESGINLVLSLALAPRFGISGVALGTAVPLIIFRLFVIPLYVGRLIGLPMRQYYWNLVPLTAFAVAYLGGVAAIANSLLVIPTYPLLALVGLGAIPLYGVVVPFVGFTSSERMMLHNALPSPLKRYTKAILSR